LNFVAIVGVTHRDTGWFQAFAFIKFTVCRYSAVKLLASRCPSSISYKAGVRLLVDCDVDAPNTQQEAEDDAMFE
jgi:hypothetical protein